MSNEDITISKGEKQRKASESAARIAKIKNTIPWIVLVVVIVGGLYWASVSMEKAQQNRPGQEVVIQGKNHIAPNTEGITYNSNPPTSGPHAGALPWGFNEYPVLDVNAIHNLEHGGIWITYKDLDNQSVEILRDIARQNSMSVLISPRAENDTSVALASWGRLLSLDSVDVDAINEFIRKNKNKSPEPIAR